MKTAIILGTAPSLAACPWDDPNIEYWACSPVITHPPHAGHRIDALFEMHEKEYTLSIADRLNKYIEKNPNCKLYLQDKLVEIPNGEKYPLLDVQSCLNHPRMRNYLTSTIAYMVALAIQTGRFNNIELYGVHMASDEEEYSLQRPCLETLLAFGWGRGINFWLPDESDIMKCSYLYGYEQKKGFLLKAIQYRDGVAHGEKELDRKMQSLRDEYNQQKGGKLALDSFIKELKKSGMV